VPTARARGRYVSRLRHPPDTRKRVGYFPVPNFGRVAAASTSQPSGLRPTARRTPNSIRLSSGANSLTSPPSTSARAVPFDPALSLELRTDRGQSPGGPQKTRQFARKSDALTRHMEGHLGALWGRQASDAARRASRFESNRFDRLVSRPEFVVGPTTPRRLALRHLGSPHRAISCFTDDNDCAPVISIRGRSTWTVPCTKGGAFYCRNREHRPGPVRPRLGRISHCATDP
jgi:hypothetical protein